jgi:hypothetical protein
MALIQKIHYQRMKVVINSYINSLKPISQMQKGVTEDWKDKCDFQLRRLNKLNDYIKKRAAKRGFKI